ncbi:MAG: single-stranded DNA-binding protein [Eggerthellaceae bacterium]|nr:single-stranded DNA-binding protein [Eggerthellaceae bacterium]
MAINKATITGNITRDPELRQTQGGTSVLTIGVAVNDRRKNQQTGEWEDYPNFIDCTMFGARAQSVSRFLSKGSKVAIEGKLNQSRWQAEDGTNRSKIEIIVDEIEFMSRQQGQTASKPVQQQPQQPMQQQAAQPQQFAHQAAPQPMQQQPMQQFAPQPMQQPMQAAPVQQAMPMMQQQAPQQVASIYDEDIPF